MTILFVQLINAAAEIRLFKKMVPALHVLALKFVMQEEEDVLWNHAVMKEEYGFQMENVPHAPTTPCHLIMDLDVDQVPASRTKSYQNLVYVQIAQLVQFQI